MGLASKPFKCIKIAQLWYKNEIRKCRLGISLNILFRTLLSKTKRKATILFFLGQLRYFMQIMNKQINLGKRYIKGFLIHQIKSTEFWIIASKNLRLTFYCNCLLTETVEMRHRWFSIKKLCKCKIFLYSTTKSL